MATLPITGVFKSLRVPPNAPTAVRHAETMTISFMITPFVSVHRFRVQRSVLGARTKFKARSPHKKCWFCHIIAKYHVPDPPASPVMYRTGISQEVGNGGQVCGDVEAVGFPVQNVYKMTYGDENATFEPLNL
jgi:hypothetical protein